MPDQFFKFFIPSFLRRLDHYLLLNYRLVWTSKLHYLLFYGGLATACIFAMGTYYPLKPAQLPARQVFNYGLLAALVVPFCWWVYCQSKFNSKKGEKSFLATEIARILLYMACTGIFLFLHIFTTVVYEQKVRQIALPGDVERDAELLNLAKPYFPSDLDYDRIYTKNLDSLCNECFTPEEIQACPMVHFSFCFFSTQGQTLFSDTLDIIFVKDQTLSSDTLTTIFVNSSRADKLKYIAAALPVLSKYGYDYSETSPEQVLALYERSAREQSPEITAWLKKNRIQKENFSGILEMLEVDPETQDWTFRETLYKKIKYWALTVIGLLALYHAGALCFLAGLAGCSAMELFYYKFPLEYTIYGVCFTKWLFFITYILLVSQLLRGWRATRFSRWYLTCTVMANLVSAMLVYQLADLLLHLGWLPETPWLVTTRGRCVIYTVVRPIVELYSLDIYFLFFHFFFYKLYMKFKSLPE